MITIVTLVVIIAGGTYWYMTRDIRRINKRFDMLIAQFAKTGVEADIDQLTKTAVVSGTFMNPVAIDFLGEMVSVGADEFKGGIYEVRSGAKKIEINVEDRQLVLDEENGRASMELKVVIFVDGDLFRIPEGANIRMEWQKDRESKDWKIAKVMVHEK